MSNSDDRKTAKDYLVLEAEDEYPSDKDLVLLSELAKAGEEKEWQETISFQGIRRRLGLHQETLSRALKRLERDGFVQRLRNEYFLSVKGKTVISRFQRAQIAESYPIPILRTILPPEAREEELEKALAHRWFGHLRWYGSTKNENSTIFTWITVDGKVSLSATISNGYLSVEGQVNSAESMALAVRAAYEIFDHVSKGLRHSARSPSKKLSESVYHAA